MNRLLLRTLAAGAAGFAAASIYRQWKAAQPPAPRRQRVPLETWENEGGAVPEPSTPASDVSAGRADERGSTL